MKIAQMTATIGAAMKYTRRKTPIGFQIASQGSDDPCC
jgi:hypothetical protein